LEVEHVSTAVTEAGQRESSVKEELDKVTREVSS